MNWVRDFSMQQGGIPRGRNIEDAPEPMRKNLLTSSLDLLKIATGPYRESAFIG